MALAVNRKMQLGHEFVHFCGPTGLADDGFVRPVRPDLKNLSTETLRSYAASALKHSYNAEAAENRREAPCSGSTQQFCNNPTTFHDLAFSSVCFRSSSTSLLIKKYKPD